MAYRPPARAMPNEAAVAYDIGVGTITIEAVREGSYGSLSPLLADLGAPGEALGVELRCDGIACDVTLSIDSGTVRGADLIAHAAGLPSMRLVREDDAHVEKKERGIIREVQTGDASFDDRVYIESSATDADVKTFFASPAVRGAAVKLLEDVGEVRIDARSVSIHVSKDHPHAFDPAAIRGRVRLLRVLAGAPRPLVTEEVPVPRAASVTKTVTYLAAPAAVLVVVASLIRYPPVTGRPVLVGVVGGLVLAALLAPVFTLLLRGRSTSHREILVCRVVAFLTLPVLVTGVLLACNGALDTSAERVVEMEVTSIAADEDDNAVMRVEAIDPERETHHYSFRTSSLPQGTTKVRARWRAGALGWTWESGDAMPSR